MASAVNAKRVTFASPLLPGTMFRGHKATMKLQTGVSAGSGTTLEEGPTFLAYDQSGSAL